MSYRHDYSILNPETCEHEWVFVRDWEGDPSLPGGMNDCSYYRCTECGEEQYEKPIDYEEPFNEPY